MTTEDTGWCELAQFVANHIFSHIHGDKLVSVVYSYSLADKIGRYHGSSRPSLNGYFLV